MINEKKKRKIFLFLIVNKFIHHHFRFKGNKFFFLLSNRDVLTIHILFRSKIELSQLLQLQKTLRKRKTKLLLHTPIYHLFQFLFRKIEEKILLFVSLSFPQRISPFVCFAVNQSQPKQFSTLYERKIVLLLLPLLFRCAAMFMYE